MIKFDKFVKFYKCDADNYENENHYKSVQNVK